jgi:ABC-type sugar transport system ATPase subunit
VPRPEARTRVDALAELLGLAGLLDQRPRDLSEEERMRVALARAIARRPAVLLLDEPLGDIDLPARRRMLDAIRSVHQDLACAVVYATKWVEEGMSLADRIAVFENGSVEQYATPIELYTRPRSMRVAGLIGNPPMNMVEGVVRGDGDRVYFESPALALELPSSIWSGLRTPGHGEVVLGIRPEHVRLAGRRAGGSLSGSVHAVEPMGSETLVHLSGPAQIFVARLHADALPTVGDALDVGFDLDRIHLFDRRTGESLIG